MRLVYLVILVGLLVSGCSYFQVPVWQQLDPAHDIRLVIDSQRPLTVKISERPLEGSLTGVQYMTVVVDGQQISVDGVNYWQDNNPDNPGFVLEFEVESAREIIISTGSGIGLVRIEIGVNDGI